MVAWLNVGHALAYRLDDTGTLVSKDDGESPLGILARQCVCICGPDVIQYLPSPEDSAAWSHTCVANTRVVDLNAHLVCLGRRDLYILDAELLAGLPSHGSLAGDGLKTLENGVSAFCC